MQDLAIAAHHYYRFCVHFFTPSSLTRCNMSLFGCPGVLPECPFNQSYDTAYAKIDPFRLNADEETGPGHGSNAVRTVIKKVYKTKRGQIGVLAKRMCFDSMITHVASYLISLMLLSKRRHASLFLLLAYRHVKSSTNFMKLAS
jgi:hypothetical protein